MRERERKIGRKGSLSFSVQLNVMLCCCLLLVFLFRLVVGGMHRYSFFILLQNKEKKKWNKVGILKYKSTTINLHLYHHQHHHHRDYCFLFPFFPEKKMKVNGERECLSHEIFLVLF